MESGFWTQGPIPLRLLEGLALDRPEAMEACRAALDRGDVAVVGGPAGSGRTTFAHQVAAKWPHASVLIDVPALLDASEAAMAHDVLAARGVVHPPPEPTWDDVARRVKGRILFIVDGAPQQADWLDRLLDRVPGAFLLLRDDGIPLDPIPDRRARDFLVRRSTAPWSPAALAEALRIARGRPDVLQRIGAAATYRAAVEREAQAVEIGEDAVLAAATEVAHHLPGAQALRLAQLSPTRMRLLRAMAFDPDATPTKWGRRSGLPLASVPVHMQRLRDEDGLVERVERGRYRILDPLVALHLRAVHGNPVRIYRPL